jgi:hypothetical protein
MVSLIIKAEAGVMKELPVFEELLQSWNMKIVRRYDYAEKGTMRLIINADFKAEIELVVTAAKTRFKDTLVKIEIS